MKRAITAHTLASLFILPLALARADAAPATAAAPVTVTVTMHTPDALEVSYRLPPACKALAFTNDGVRAQAAVHLRSDWKPVDDCTRVDFQSVRPAHAACTTLRLRVPATTRARDTRVYGAAQPWAQPVGGGLYAHTAAYAVQGCGKVDWRFEAPGGTVMVDGSMAPDAVERAAAAVRSDGLAALLLAQPYRADAVPFHADARIPEPTRAMLAATVDAALGALRALLPGARLAPAYVLALPDAAPGLGGDVANGTVLRLHVPEQEPADLRAQARILIAHELAHLAQPPGWPAPHGADAGALREGGAEFLRLAIALRLGWNSEDEVRDTLEAAINGCAAAAGARPWRAIEGRGKDALARHCGLALHALALARPAHASALRRLQMLYAGAGADAGAISAGGIGGGRTEAGHIETGHIDATRIDASRIDASRIVAGRIDARSIDAGILRALECGADAACAPRLPAALAGAAPLRTVLDEEARRPDALLTATPAWGPALTETMALRHLDLLVRADCHGQGGVYPDRAAPRIGPGLRCGVLREGMVPETAEGLPLFADGAAVAASQAACRARGATTLGLRGGAGVTVRCGKEAGAPVRVVGVDPARMLELMRQP